MPKVGEPFNPFELFHGIFIPEAIVRQPNLSPGVKLCFGLLCRFASGASECFPSAEVVGTVMGVTERQARRYIQELRAHQLVETVRRGDGQTNLYFFPWHPIFDDKSVVLDRTDLVGGSDRTDESALAGSDRTDESALAGSDRTDESPLNRSPLPPHSPSSFSSKKEVFKASPLTPQNVETKNPEDGEGNQKTSTLNLIENLQAKYRAARGSPAGKPKGKTWYAFAAWLEREELDPDSVRAAFDAFLADDFWRKEHFPLPAFQKHFRKYQDMANGGAPVPQVKSQRDDRRVIPRDCAVRLETPAMAISSFPARWNELVPASPISEDDVREVDRKIRTATVGEGLAGKFAKRFDSMCERVQTALSKAPEDFGYLDIHWLLKHNGVEWNWQKAMRPTFGWKPRARPPGGKPTPGENIEKARQLALEEIRGTQRG